jgi:hypothetical protein
MSESTKNEQSVIKIESEAAIRLLDELEKIHYAPNTNPNAIEWYVDIKRKGKTTRRLEIHTDDHNPPHFHVPIGGYEYRFEIETCKAIDDWPDKQSSKLIKFYHMENKDELMREWINSRPTQ